MFRAQMYIAIFTLFFASSCLLAGAQKIIPGIYGDDEWQANRKYTLDAESFWVVVNNEKTSSDGQCVQDVSIGGKGVFDVIELECNTVPITHADNYEVIVGNRVYSDAVGSLIFVRPDNSCVRKAYRTNWGNRLSTSETYLSAAECGDVRRKMKDTLTEIGRDIIGEQSPLWQKFLRRLDQDIADTNSVGNSQKISYDPSLEPSGVVMGWSIRESRPFSLDGRRVKVVHIKLPGRTTQGEQYLVPENENTGLVINNGNSFIGNSFFSDFTDILVVLSGNSCIQRTYSGSATPKSEDITGSARCQAIRSEVIRLSGKVGSNVVIIGGRNQSPQTTQAPQYSQGPSTAQMTQSTQGNQISHDNQITQNDQVAQLLSQVADTLLGLLNQLASTLSVGGQPDQLGNALGDALNDVKNFMRNRQGNYPVNAY